MEQLNYNLLFRWFVGLSVDDPVWVPTVFSKNRDRLLAGDIAAEFMAAVLHLPRVGANMDLLKLGADSIQLFQIVARSSREGFQLTVKELLQLRTLRAVAASIDDSASRADPGVRKSLPTLGQFQRGRKTASTTKR